MVAKGIKSLFQRNSPFAIKPRLDPALWSWLLHFAARCNERDMIEAGRGIQPLLLSSLALYRDLIERESLDCEFETHGLLFAYRSQDGNGGVRRDGPADERGISLPGPAISTAMPCVELEPALRPGLAGGWYYHDDAHLRPDKLMQRLAARPRSRRSDDPRELRVPGFSMRRTAEPWSRTRPRVSFPPTCSSSRPAHGRRS